LLAACGSSENDEQTAAILRLDQRVSNLEAAAANESENNNSVQATQSNTGPNFMDLASNLAANREAADKQFAVDMRLRNIEDRLDRVEEGQREIEAREMARNIR
jgi:hypothetical protein